jgi:hypothetical protein
MARRVRLRRRPRGRSLGFADPFDPAILGQRLQEQEQTGAMKENAILRLLIEQVEERLADAQEAGKEAGRFWSPSTP